VVYYHYTVNYDCTKQFKERRMLKMEFGKEVQQWLENVALLGSAAFNVVAGSTYIEKVTRRIVEMHNRALAEKEDLEVK
jgi:hypothetical protein